MLHTLGRQVYHYSIVGFIAICSIAARQAEAADIDQVLKRPDACEVPLSEMRKRLAAARTAEENAEAAEIERRWGCYNPQPGHPTIQDKREYIARVSRFAKDAEQAHRVPAAVIAAMALVESGYGHTRTALEANNLFGWKSPKTAPQTSYVLACQDATGEFGDKDSNRCYRRFGSEAESVDYVAGRLAAGFTVNYAKANKQFQDDTLAKRPTIERAQNWIVGISNPYNWQPTKYAQTICRLMREPINGSDQIDVDNNLYRLTAREGEALSTAEVLSLHRSCSSLEVPQSK